jgi:hypothetical protein
MMTIADHAARGGTGALRPEPARLARGVLTNFDIAAATLANIAPAMSFFFGFATLVTTAGIAAPLTVIAAAIAIALLGNTLTQFSRSRPSTGSAGRNTPRWPRRARTREPAWPAPCSRASRWLRSCTCFSLTPRSSASTTMPAS